MNDSRDQRRQRAAPKPLLETDSVVDGRFRIVREIGRGGMGAVYEAINVRLRKRVALKVLKPELAGRKNAARRFLREARAASQISHHNIVNIHDFGELERGDKVGLVYYVMEYLKGRDLDNLVQDVGRLQWPRARGILLQTVRALKAAHDVGIIHRDVKPGNVFLVEAGADQPADVVKVLDFGIAKVDGASPGTQVLTSMGDLMGTAWYMAPELALGAAADARSDIYAMGVLMYQVFTGAVPFGGTDSFSVLLRHANEAPKPLEGVAPDLPAPVREIVMRCLAKEPTARHESMRALELALSAVSFVGELGEPARGVAAGQRPGMPVEPPMIEMPRASVPAQPPAAAGPAQGFSPPVSSEAVIPGRPRPGVPGVYIPEKTAILDVGNVDSVAPEATSIINVFPGMPSDVEHATTPLTEYLESHGLPSPSALAPAAQAPAPSPDRPSPANPGVAPYAAQRDPPTAMLEPSAPKPTLEHDEDEAPTMLRSVDVMAALRAGARGKVGSGPLPGGASPSRQARPGVGADAVPAPPSVPRPQGIGGPSASARRHPPSGRSGSPVPRASPSGQYPVAPGRRLHSGNHRAVPAPPMRPAVGGAPSGPGPHAPVARAGLSGPYAAAPPPAVAPAGLVTAPMPRSPAAVPAVTPKGATQRRPLDPGLSIARARRRAARGHARQRWILVAVFGGVLALALGGWVALLLTKRNEANKAQPPVAAPAGPARTTP